jgi:hypothetical protein
MFTLGPCRLPLFFSFVLKTLFLIRLFLWFRFMRKEGYGTPCRCILPYIYVLDRGLQLIDISLNAILLS